MAGVPRDPVSVVVYAVLAGIGDRLFRVSDVYPVVTGRTSLAVLPINRMLELAVISVTRRVLVRAREDGHRRWLCVDGVNHIWKRYGACSAAELRTALELRENQLDQDRRARSQMIGFLRKLEAAERRGLANPVVDDIVVA